jgi:hypothetical protein
MNPQTYYSMTEPLEFSVMPVAVGGLNALLRIDVPRVERTCTYNSTITSELPR